MTTPLAHPLSHPLSYPSLSEPPWARSAVAAVLGTRWPSGDESATWDVADRWYALADALSGPRLTAFEAAEQIMTGLRGAQIAPDGFHDAWERLSGDADAPLNALVQIAAELGQLVEECGREIEAAKLAAWVEVGTLLTELTELSIAVELTSGAARPAGDGLIVASRVAVERLFDRLTERAGREVPGAATEAAGYRAGRRVLGATKADVEMPGLETRRISAADRLAGEDRLTTDRGATDRGATDRGAADRGTLPAETGMATRRLALQPRADDRVWLAEDGPGEAMRRLDPIELWAADNRSVVSRQRTAGSHDPAVDIDQVRRADYADFLFTVADGIRANLAAVISAAETDGDRALLAYAEEIAAEAGLVRSRPGLQPTEPAPGWARTDRRRAPTVRSPGELRPADGVPQKALAAAVPQAGDGEPDRLADPRVGSWFSLLNGGGPSADPTRGLNCLDAVLALFETYQDGRPRVAAARVFDGYAHGEPDRPVGGEWSGVRRIQRATESEFQNLCPFVGGADPGPARAAVDAALRNLANHLHNSGHGAFAFILTDFDSGGCHAWAAVNQGGAILFLDPQVGRISAEEPLYRLGVVSMDALVIDAQGKPAPLPYHGAGQWTAQALVEGPH